MNMVKLKELGRIVTGNTPSKKVNEFYESNDIPFIKPDRIVEVKILNLSTAKEFISNKAEGKARVVGKGSILVTCIGIIGKIGIVTCDKVAFNQQINAILPDKTRVDSKYLAYLLMYNKKGLQAIANAAVVPIINKSQFGEYEIFIHKNINIQIRISNVLDKAQELIDKRKEQIEDCDELIKSLFYHMFFYVDETKILADICLKITDGTHQSPNFISKGIPFLLVSNINNYKIDYRTNKFISETEFEMLIKRTPIEVGDILYTVVGSYGNPAVVKSREKFIFQRHIGYLKPNKEIVNSDFLARALTSDFVVEQVERRVKGIAQKTLNLSELRQLKIPAPPLPLQNEFAQKVEKIEQSKQLLEQSLTELENNFKSLMQRAFKGELF